MKKWIFSLALGLSATLTGFSHQEMTDHGHEVVPQKFLPSESDYLAPNSISADYLAVKGIEISGFSGRSLEKLQLAFKVLEIVVNTEEFKDRIINFKNSKGLRQFASNKGLTNEEIYHFFMEGRETLQQNTPGEMNFYLRLYNRPWSRVIGYTTGDTNTINVNWKYFKKFEAADVASNLAHEWTHKIGFDHTSAKEHDSAPYAIGYIVNDMASKLMKNNRPH